MPLFNFLRNSVISIPVLVFLIAIAENNIYLIFLTIGLIVNAFINHTIKKITTYYPNKIFLRPIKARGCSSNHLDKPCGGKPGFPSGHSQNAWFFTMYMILYYLNKNHNNKNPLDILIFIILAFTISISRLGISPYLGTLCHTPLQVVVGGLLGIVLSYFYFHFIFKMVST